jgi:Zn-dependent protease with chaperone function
VAYVFVAVMIAANVMQARPPLSSFHAFLWAIKPIVILPMQRLAIACAAFLISGSAVAAEQPSLTPAADVTPPPGGVLSPDNPGAFDPERATEAWLNTVPAEKRAKSDAYFEGGYWLILWNFLWGSAVFLFLLQSRISARLRDLAERLTDLKALQVVAYTIAFILLVTLLTLPLNVYQGYFRERQYGLATQTFGPWFAEQVKALGFALIGFSIAFVILYAVFRRAPRTWWMWGAIVATCLVIFGSFIQPVYVEPVFNTYRPLEDPKLRDPILAMARANQIPVKQVFVFDASRQTTRISGNVAGFFGTMRIALNDNLVNQCTVPEVRVVMAHEMGHYLLDHQVKLAAAQGILFLVVFGLTARFFDGARRRWGENWGVRGIGDPAGLPLLALILGAIFFVLTPVTNTVTRIAEREADVFGLNIAREPTGMAKIALKLGTYRKLSPGPIEEAIFFDHPSGQSRIHMAMVWEAEQLTCGEVKK